MRQLRALEHPSAGRAIWIPDALCRDAVGIDTTASRFHPASIAGLVVGAMGVFVFTMALRHWLMERRRFRERSEGA